MPRVLRRSRDRLGLTQEHVDALLTGHDFCGAFNGAEIAMRHAWDSLRDELLQQWIAEHPGTRPWAWWKFDAPELRRRVNGVHPFENVERTAHCRRVGIPEADYLRIFFGKPGCLIPPPHADDFDALYETELGYLERLGLLTEAEQFFKKEHA
jgi:hypothetical protein